MDKIALENKGSLFSRAGDGVIYKFSGGASQAVKTCIKIKESLVDFNKTVNKFRHPIVVRMGVNTGSILIDGTLKDGGGGKVPSRTIDLAGHLQKEAAPNEILISEETLNRLKEKDLFEERGYLQKDKIKVYRYKE